MSDLVQRIEEAKKKHKAEIDSLGAEIADFREEYRGHHEDCGYLQFRINLCNGHRMVWNALNDLQRGE